MPGMYANDILRHHCENATGTLAECVEENTFGLNETIHSAHSKDKTTPLMGSKVWKTHLTSMQFGRGYTMRFDWNSSADYDQVYLLLNQSLDSKAWRQFSPIFFHSMKSTGDVSG